MFDIDTETYLPPELVSKGVSLFTLDSFDIRIPLSEVTILSEELASKGVIVTEADSETGEVYNQKIKTSPQTLTLGSDITKNKRVYSIQGNKSGIGENLRIKLSAKSLGSNYFYGISSKATQEPYEEYQSISDTLPLLYEVIISDSVVDFTFDSFLEGKLTDYDFKRDFIFEGLLSDLVNFYKHYQSSYNRTGKRNRFCEVDSKPEALNIGLQINDRRHSKSISGSFCKSYYKGGLLLTGDKSFREEYLSDLPEYVLRTIHRQEFTVSGLTHSKALGLGDDTSLRAVASLSQDVIQRAFNLILKANFTKEPISMNTSEHSLSTRQEILISALKYILRNESYADTIRILTQELSTKNRRYQVKADIREMTEYILSSEHIKEVTEVPERLKEQKESYELLSGLFPLDEEE
jgi:hypothetical protein